MEESNLRSLAKAVSWRLTGTADTFILSWIVTGELKLASTIALAEVFSKVALYWGHERIWNRINVGRHNGV